MKSRLKPITYLILLLVSLGLSVPSFARMGADCIEMPYFFLFDEMEIDCALLDGEVGQRIICNVCVFCNCYPQCCEPNV